MPSQISCFSLSICPLSQNLYPPPLNAARPTPTTPRQVWWMKLWWNQCTNNYITNHNNKLHTSMTLFIVMNPVQAACIQLLCKLYAVSRINNSVKTYTVGRICLTRGSSRSNIGLLLRMLWVVVCFQSRRLTICKHGLFTANRWAKCPWNMPDTRMFTNCKASAIEADNNSQHAQ